MIDISIIIVNFNTDKLVRDCVASIKRTVEKTKYEIIVVDNGSEEIFPDSKDYSLTRNGSNLGFAKANNQGIDWAIGKYILLLNSDTIVTPGAIDKLVEFAESREGKIGALAPRLLNPDKSIQPSCFRFPTIGLALNQYFLGKKNLLDKYYPEGEAAIEVDVAVMAAFLITPLALKEVGLLDEKYFMYFEDFDYCRRIKKAGLGVYYLPTAQVIHIHGASHGKNKYLIESAKKYHGFVGYYMHTFILWLGQKWEKIKK